MKEWYLRNRSQVCGGSGLESLSSEGSAHLLNELSFCHKTARNGRTQRDGDKHGKTEKQNRREGDDRNLRRKKEQQKKRQKTQKRTKQGKRKRKKGEK
jgi:hypothetical protein